MQRKAYVTGTAALLAALLTGCTSGSGSGGRTDDANPDDAGTATVAAQPGKYRSLPEPCGAVGHDTLDAMLPGIKQITDPGQRDKAYRGEATLTYNTERKVGCHWKVESSEAVDRLSVDLERVVSYDNAVSDDDQARKLFQGMETAADLPAPSPSTPADPTGSPDSSDSSASSASSGSSGSSGSGPSPAGATTTPTPKASASGGTPASPDGSGTPSDSSSGTASADLQPRVLTDLGDEAYLDDELNTSGSTAEQRTVTVVFRTSNVVVTLEYEEQPTATGTVPDSKEMQDRARDLASQLADALNG
ncbi:hypothetical protein [Streptomyces collinus]|uniref:Secreted serine-rich protein n=1 Tax=Streptomyces collinus (strain DSM 40733 / Tue 365) TaxID=1214242 RepID=S5V764_STRC3|nr:hypothetical protein [Streptomyces collinus]AGS71034.1 secreted serine-rich protein [Streptomyces collinus Tu 365]UJA09685.1 hypothetical protein HGI10_36410 [Streptomyces collinus]UJA15451.1 hypothetical protein HGI09_27710 [Streptomyces collinus]